MSTSQPHEVVWSVATAMLAARSLQTVAELAIADRIADEPVSAARLAEDRNVDGDALDRVLHLLSSHGIFQRSGDGWAHNDASRVLRADHPMSLRPFVRMMGMPMIWGSVTGLSDSVLTGAPSPGTIGPGGAWDYLQANAHQATIFGEAMTAKAGADIGAVLAAYDFTRFAIIADIGGGRGHLLHAVLNSSPTSNGILFDLPAVIDVLPPQHDRCTAHAGDFFTDPLPTADAYVMMEVIHDWPDDRSLAILTAARAAAAPGATLLVIESLITEEQPDPRARILDIIMLTVTGGRERTSSQLDELLRRTGWQQQQVIDTAGPMRILEATAM